MKLFHGWAVIKSRNGSNWGLEHDRKEWPIVEGPVPTRSEAVTAMNNHRKSDCLPLRIRKIYK